MHFGAECTDNDTHDNRAAGNAQSDRTFHAGNADRNSAERQPKEHSQENAADIRFIECLDRIAEVAFNMVNGFVLSHDCDAVSILQSQVTCGQQLRIATQYTAHIDAIRLAKMQLSESLPIEFSARQH